MNRKSAEGLAPALTFPFAPFERSILAMLAEVDPAEITGGDTGPDEVMALGGELAQVEAKIAELEAELLNGDVAAVVKVLRSREARKRELVGLLAEERQKAAHPLREAWGEAHTTLAALEAAVDPLDARLRLMSCAPATSTALPTRPSTPRAPPPRPPRKGVVDNGTSEPHRQHEV